MTPEQARASAALLLIRRLVKNHGLTVEEAVTAVTQRRQNETGPHTHLVAQEATAVVREAAAPLRAFAEAIRPALAAATAAMAELARALRTATTPLPAPHPTGPSGPPRTARHRAAGHTPDQPGHRPDTLSA